MANSTHRTGALLLVAISFASACSGGDQSSDSNGSKAQRSAEVDHMPAVARVANSNVKALVALNAIHTTGGVASCEIRVVGEEATIDLTSVDGYWAQIPVNWRLAENPPAPTSADKLRESTMDLPLPDGVDVLRMQLGAAGQPPPEEGASAGRLVGCGISAEGELEVAATRPRTETPPVTASEYAAEVRRLLEQFDAYDMGLATVTERGKTVYDYRRFADSFDALDPPSAIASSHESLVDSLRLVARMIAIAETPAAVESLLTSAPVLTLAGSLRKMRAYAGSTKPRSNDPTGRGACSKKEAGRLAKGELKSAVGGAPYVATSACGDFTGDGVPDMIFQATWGASAFTSVAVAREGDGWRLALTRQGMPLLPFKGDVIASKKVLRPNDPNCCPTGGWDHERLHWSDGSLRVVDRFHTDDVFICSPLSGETRTSKAANTGLNDDAISGMLAACKE